MDLELFLYAMALWGVHIFYNTPHRCLSRAKVPVNFCEQSMYLQRYQHELSLLCVVFPWNELLCCNKSLLVDLITEVARRTGQIESFNTTIKHSSIQYHALAVVVFRWTRRCGCQNALFGVGPNQFLFLLLRWKLFRYLHDSLVGEFGASHLVVLH